MERLKITCPACGHIDVRYRITLRNFICKYCGAVFVVNEPTIPRAPVVEPEHLGGILEVHDDDTY